MPQGIDLRFLCFDCGNSPHGAAGYVCAPKPLPALVSILDSPPAGMRLSMHPSAALKQLRDQLSAESAEPGGGNSDARQIAIRNLSIVQDFRVWIEAPRQTIALYLAADIHAEPFDPPPESGWIELPNSWHLSAFERDLLRAAYSCLLG